MPLTRILIVGVLAMISSVALAQDDVIDDLPKERKEAAKAANKRSRKPKTDQPQLQPRPNLGLIDDLSPEQKAEGETKAAHKTASAIPDDLADALARALHNSPAILVADAKVRQAQAELNEVRLSVVQELTLAFQRRANNKEVLAVHEALLANLRKDNAVSKDEQQLELAKWRQPIIEDESRILYLLGVGAEHAEGQQASANDEPSAGGAMGMMMRGMGGMSGMGGMMGAARPGGTGMAPMMGGGMPGGGMMGGGIMGGGMMAGGAGGGGMTGGMGAAASGAKAEPPPEEVRGRLKKTVEVDFAEQPLGDVLDYLSQANGVTFIKKEKTLDVPVTLKLREVPLEAVLQALADLTEYCFIFRDYGILVINRSQARSYMGGGGPLIGPGMAPGK